MSVVVGFLYMSASSLVCLRVIVRSRNVMELCFSYVGLSFMLFCIMFMYVLMVCKLILVMSNMTNMSSTYRTQSAMPYPEVVLYSLPHNAAGIFRQLG